MSILLPHPVALLFLGQHHSPSSSSAYNLSISCASSPSGSLSHDEPWSSSSSMLLAHFYGQFTPMCPCSPQSSQCRVSLLPFASIGSCVFDAIPVTFAALAAFLALVHSSAPFPRCHGPDRLGPFLPAPLPALYPFQAMAHTSSYDMSLPVSESPCVDFVSCPLTFPKSHWYGSVVGHRLIDDDLQLFHDFVELSRSRQELTFDVHPASFPSQGISSAPHRPLSIGARTQPLSMTML